MKVIQKFSYSDFVSLAGSANIRFELKKHDYVLIDTIRDFYALRNGQYVERLVAFEPAKNKFKVLSFEDFEGKKVYIY